MGRPWLCVVSIDLISTPCAITYDYSYSNLGMILNLSNTEIDVIQSEFYFKINDMTRNYTIA